MMQIAMGFSGTTFGLLFGLGIASEVAHQPLVGALQFGLAGLNMGCLVSLACLAVRDRP